MFNKGGTYKLQGIISSYFKILLVIDPIAAVFLANTQVFLQNKE